MKNRFIIIICICLVGHNGGGDNTFFFAAADVPPSPSPIWRADGNTSYRRNADIPIMGDHLFRGSKHVGSKDAKNQRGSANRSRNRRKDDAYYDTSDDDDGDYRIPYFLFEQDDDHHRQRRRHKRKQRNVNQPLDSIRHWTLEKTGVHIPRINMHFDPITTLKIRKSWHNIIPWAIIRVGADFETHRLGRGLWRLRGCVEDKLLGGRFTIKESRYDDDRCLLMEYSKSWLFAGAGSTGTRFNLCAAYDLMTQRGSARFGFRTESTDAIGTYQLMPGRKGFSIVPIVKLDNEGRFLLETKTNFELPEPEFVIGTDFDGDSTHGGIGSLGMGIGGDVDVEVEEVNLIFSF